MQVIEQTIKQKIFTIRGKQVMIDKDLPYVFTEQDSDKFKYQLITNNIK